MHKQYGKATAEGASRTASAREAAARRAVIDEYGDVQDRLAKLEVSPDVARLAQLAKDIRSWFLGADSGKPCEVDGDHYHATLSARGVQTSIPDLQAVYDRVGHDVFLENCSMTLGSLEKSLGKLVSSELTVKTQTGSRSLTVTALE